MIYRTPTQNRVAAKIPAKKGWRQSVSVYSIQMIGRTHAVMYTPHIRRAPLQQLLHSHLHSITRDQRQGHTDKNGVVADQPQGENKNQERPEEGEAREEPPRVLDGRNRKLLRAAIRLVARLAQRPPPLPCCVHLFGRHSRRLPVIVLGEPVSAVLQQLLDAALAALDERPVQRREALVIRSIHVRAPAQEQVHTRRIAFICGPHERSVGLRIGDVDGHVLVQQQDELVDVAIEGGRVQQIEALVVGEQRVGAMLEQQVDDVVVAALRGPEHGGGYGVAAFGVDGGARLDQEVAEGVVVVDGRPL